VTRGASASTRPDQRKVDREFERIVAEIEKDQS
jgi:hypothetical protein